MVLLSSETRRYTSYGKRRVNGGTSTATRHAQWMEMMGNPTNTDDNNDDDPPPAPLPASSSSAFITPREVADQNKAGLAKESQRQRIVSLSSSENDSASSSSSSDIHIIPTQPARKPVARAKKLRVVESPVSSPTSKQEYVAVLKARRPALMARKDSSNIPQSSSPIKKGKEPVKENKAKTMEVNTIEEKENSRLQPQASMPKLVESRPTVISTLSYRTPNVPLHSTPAKPHPSHHKSKAASSSTPSYLLSRPMALPPPRGHGQHADVAWRRPLTPLVHSNRYGTQNNNNDKRPKQQEKQVKENPKRPPREREPVSPIAPSKKRAEATVPISQHRKSIIEVVIPRSRTASPAVSTDKTASEQTKQRDSISSHKSGGTRVIDLSEESDKEVSIEIVRHQEIATEPALAQQAAAAGSAVKATTEVAETASVVPDDVKPLLQACSPYSDKIHTFSSIIDTFPLLSLYTTDKTAVWTKLGEATYSEVFVVSSSAEEDSNTADEIVVKVIPIHRPPPENAPGGVKEQDLPQTSLVQDVVREVEITKLLSRGEIDKPHAGSISGFTHLRGAYLTSGQYPAKLLSAWDDFSKTRPEKVENARPDVFPDTQLYLLFCLSHGGTDLESFRVKNWVQACSILHQVATSLSLAESSVQFEHRDLHWGNILIKPSEQPEAPSDNEMESLPECLRSVPRDVAATIIDFTLSRATKQQDGQILSGGLEDEALFDGEGDQQYECYRLMRRLTKEDWQSYCPITNVVWLHYLSLKLLNDKKLKKPVRKATGPRTRTLASRAVSHTNTPTKLRAGKPTMSAPDFEMEKAAYDSLKAASAILSASIEAALATVEATNGADKPKRKSRAAKTSSTSQESDNDQVCANAGEFVLWWTYA